VTFRQPGERIDAIFIPPADASVRANGHPCLQMRSFRGNRGRRPLIGVTTSELRMPPQVRPTAEGDPPQCEMALGMVYLRAVERAGGLPVVLPPLALDALDDLLDGLDGVCLSGGPDLDPLSYGAPPHPELGDVEPALDAFELAVARAADERGMPLLGICRGAQALNVARGGTLHQHVADLTDGSIEHRQAQPGRATTHTVEIAPGSLLAETMRTTSAPVNSFHHQAVDRLGEGLRAVAWAPDGIIEAVEATGETLYLGVQWHAEGLVDHFEHRRLFEAFVAQAAEWTTPMVRAA
jgi:putative glutamine amidotransferase